MWWYNLGMHAYAGMVKTGARFKHKAKLWVDGRQGIFESLSSVINNDMPVVWVHAASLGEFEQGRTIIESIKANYPEYKILLTFFSPSGYEIRKDYPGADFVFYLPMDTRRNAKRFLDIVNPEIAIFIKYEFWLNYLTELKRRGCRTFIISAIFRTNSIFFRPYGGAFRKALGAYEHLFVQNEESKKLLSRIKVTNVTVAGDTRFDRVAQIAAAAKKLPVVESFAGQGRVFVAGSTWGPDENILIPLMNGNPGIKFIIAPHEMEIARITSLIENTKGGAVRYTECSEGMDCSSKQLMIIDTIGILSSVYQYGDFSYIGGGFGVGIHNTLEAVTFGLPVAFGPNYHRFKEARELIELGVATPVSSEDELAAWFDRLVSDPVKYDLLRDAACQYISDHKGATDIVIQKIFGEARQVTEK